MNKKIVVLPSDTDTKKYLNNIEKQFNNLDGKDIRIKNTKFHVTKNGNNLTFVPEDYNNFIVEHNEKLKNDKNFQKQLKKNQNGVKSYERNMIKSSNSYEKMEKQYCEDTGGIWIPTYTRKNGIKVSGFCRKK
jgi:hypothetical protein